MPSLGINGVGWAWLAAQFGGSLVVVHQLVRRARSSEGGVSSALRTALPFQSSRMSSTLS
jgi:hypothetical protein